MPTKDLNDLREPLRTSALAFWAKAQTLGIPDLRIAEVKRTVAEQYKKVRRGYSKTLQSNHITGLAFDVYVKDYNQKYYDQLWELSKEYDYLIYPHYDLKWWERWKFKDVMHFEYNKNKKGIRRYDMTVEQISDVLARVWKQVNAREPDMESINKEATDAFNRYNAGERYAVNSYIDKYFAEVSRTEPAPATDTGWKVRVTAEKLNIRTGPHTADTVAAVVPEGTTFDVIAEVEGDEINGNKTWFKVKDSGYYATSAFLERI